MKFFEKNKKITILAAVVIILATIIIIIKLIPANQTITAINDAQEPAETTAVETTTTLETTKAPETETTTVQTTEETQKTTQATVATETKPVETQPPATSPAVEITLAPVEVPNSEVMDILEENNVQIVETTPAIQTTPPNGAPEGAQGKNKYGNYYKIVDGKEFVWDNTFGWIPGGEGTTEIMDVESNGRSYDGY